MSTVRPLHQIIADLLAELETAKRNNDTEAIARIEWDLALAYNFNR